MYQTNYNQPWYGYSVRDHDDVIQKYNNVCQLVQELTEIIKHLELKIIAVEKRQEHDNFKSPKRCRYFNVGYCKKGSDCLHSHPQETCQEYLESGACPSFRSCRKRHPKECRYWKRYHCLRGNECMFLHQAAVGNIERNQKVDKNVNVEDKKESVETELVEEKEESVETVLVEDDEESVETVTVEDEEKSVETVTVEDIITFYENDFNIDSDGNFMIIGEIDPIKCRKNSINKNDVRLQKSTRKSKKLTKNL